MITKHTDICCKKGKCEEFDFRPKDRIDMKRHMRDMHEVMSSSTSPPLKRNRKIKEQPRSDFVHILINQAPLPTSHLFFESNHFIKNIFYLKFW